MGSVRIYVFVCVCVCVGVCVSVCLCVCFHVNVQFATISTFLTRFQFCFLYIIALCEGFKTSSQNFDLWPGWPLNLILDLNCTLYYKMLLLRHFHPISIQFALCGIARWGKQNFFTKFWPLTLFFVMFCTCTTKCYYFAIFNLFSIVCFKFKFKGQLGQRSKFCEEVLKPSHSAII